jgi:hypothetical protein
VSDSFDLPTIGRMCCRIGSSCETSDQSLEALCEDVRLPDLIIFRRVGIWRQMIAAEWYS